MMPPSVAIPSSVGVGSHTTVSISSRPIGLVCSSPTSNKTAFITDNVNICLHNMSKKQQNQLR